MFKILIILLNLRGFQLLNNGLATRPPMGWSSWLTYGCNPCDHMFYNTQCLSEIAIEETTRLLVQEGYSQLGYQYVILDDCWQSPQRDATWRLQPNRLHFPKGIRALAQYVHDNNLKLGIFSDLGPQTGGGRPGSGGFLQIDAQTFAEWGVDYIKMSAANISPYMLDRDYSIFGTYLNKTGRPILYATSWVVFQEYHNIPVNYYALPSVCNTWRFAYDIQPTWSHILGIMDNYSSRQFDLRKIAGPGAWNDADLLVIGNRGITLDQSQVQMAIWSIMAAPLIFSTDIRSMGPEFKAVLQNKNVIAVDQDPLGKPGYKFQQQSDIDVWMRPISPAVNGEYSYAVAFVNRNQFGIAVGNTIVLKELGLTSANGYYVTDLFPSTIPGEAVYNMTPMKPDTILQMKINPSGVAFFKVELIVNVNPFVPYITPVADSNNEIIRYVY